jgi:hypothetical protein
MPDIPFFGKDDTKRISEDVRWGESVRQKGGVIQAYDHTDVAEITYVKLIEKDPDGHVGLWAAQEVYYRDGFWELIDTERVWDGTAESYVRHFSFGEAEIGQIVKLRLISDTNTGLEEWVFDTDVTNPEAFVFYADDNGNAGQARKDSSWTIKTPGKVLTNVGEANIRAPYTMAPGGSCSVQIIFIDYGEGYQLASAAMTSLGGQYWTESEGVITVNHRIARVDVNGDVSRLVQYHAGDIHIEVFSFSSDPDDPDDPDDPYDPYKKNIKVVGDNIWINVVRAGNTYTVNHLPPPQNQALSSMKGLDKTFDCSNVAFSTVADVQTWVNNIFLAKIAELFYDTRGHIYKQTDCDGGGIVTTEDPTSEYLVSELNGDYVSGTTISPDAINGVGIDFNYLIYNNGKNFLDYIGVKSIQVGLISANGKAIKIGLNGAAPIAFNVAKLAQNVFGTSGLRSAGFDDGPALIGVERFQFNSTAKLSASVIGIGLAQTQVFNTLPCTITTTTNSTIVLDRTDFFATPMSISFGTGVANMGSASSPGLVSATDNGPYLIDMTFRYSDNSPALVSISGSDGPWKTGHFFLELDSNGDTGTFDDVWFQIPSDIDPGETIKVCAVLRTWDELTDVNVETCTTLNINYEDECITDESGENVTDDSGECITGGAGTEWSDDFGGSSIDTTRWDSVTGTQITLSGGDITLISNPFPAANSAQQIGQSFHTLTGDFSIQLSVASSKSDGSTGFSNRLTATIGGTEYDVAHFDNNTVDGVGYYIYNGSSFVFQESSAATITNQVFEISRVGSTVSLKRGSTTYATFSNTGTLTGTTIGSSNSGGGGPSGNPELVASDFSFEAPIGTPYIS